MGLGERGDDLFRSYSLGMKQRLGVAAALLPEPELLVLDEPANGLDPAGIREIRALLRRLADGGMTVFVSSHLLSEIEAVCDHLVVIDGGRIRFQGPTRALVDGQRSEVVAAPEHAEDLAALAELCERSGHPARRRRRRGPRQRTGGLGARAQPAGRRRGHHPRRARGRPGHARGGVLRDHPRIGGAAARARSEDPTGAPA